jgi:hypothetical protein
MKQTRKFYLIIFLFSFSIFHLSSFLSYGQADFNFADALALDTNSYSKVILHSGYFFSSNAMTNEISSEYARNGFITDEMKDGVSENLEGKNRFGGSYDANLFFVFHPDSVKRHFHAFAGIRVRNHIDSRFPKDLFEVYFRGNKNYAGKTADFSDFELNSYQYKQFTAGIANQYLLHKGKLFIGAGINVTGGRRFTKIKTGHTTLYTYDESQYIDSGWMALDGDFDVTYQRDDSASATLIPTEGKGIAANFFAEYENHSGNKFFISVENFGNIFWNRYSTTVRIDSSFHFEGIDVSDLFDFNDSLRSVSIDSTYYENFLTNRKTERITTKLPCNLTASITHPFLVTRINMTVGATYLANANAELKYFIIGNYKMNAKNEFSLVLSYGGYDAFNAGIKYERQFSHGFSVEAGSDYLSSMISYNKGRSQGAYLSLAKKFQ